MVNIDTVYQKVLSIANKEQRGYITPQEFNLLANKAQMEIFSEYFYEQSKFRKMLPNDTVYSDREDDVQERIDHFEKFMQNVEMNNGGNNDVGVGLLPDYFKMGKVYYENTSGSTVEIVHIDQNDFNNINNSPQLKPTTSRPVYVRFSIEQDDNVGRERRIKIYPIGEYNIVKCNYIAKPKDPNWGFVVVNGKALYNSDKAIHFELHASEEENLVNRILQLSGIIIESQELYQAALVDKQLTTQQKNN